ncbi:MAG: RtcB family protein [Candidatus Marinimicrobia bacterium]|nr:RtcB family protein [Candidatus Neomarinimicrobiota bacterium]
MIELKGTFGKARIFTNHAEKECILQVKELLEQNWVTDLKIRIMPDCHAGLGCTIGTTMTINDKIVPNLVGVDIGCGMTMAKLGKISFAPEKLDQFIRKNIPAGFDIHDKRTEYPTLYDLNCLDFINQDRALKSIGTLGSGNHFIEVNKDDEDNFYLVIHSGSRHLGKQIAEYYQELAYQVLLKNHPAKTRLINDLKKKGKQQKIQQHLKQLQLPKKDLAYLEKTAFSNYLHDMAIAQQYATSNRKAMMQKILNDFLVAHPLKITETIHNYIDLETKILRKGAISAQSGEEVLIPMNMRDGSLICLGKGNADWNFSAPHGAGRTMSRTQAKKIVNLQEFRDAMVGIYTTSVSKSTLDEAPRVYKPMEEIVENIQDTVTIKKIIKPVYNFKA